MRSALFVCLALVVSRHAEAATQCLPKIPCPDAAGNCQVNSASDQAASGAGGNNCEISPTGACQCTLRAAIQTLNAYTGPTPGPYTITFAPAVASGVTLTTVGAGEDAGATGDLDITTSINIVGALASDGVSPGTTVGWAAAPGNDRVFHVIATSTFTPVVTFTNLVIQNGYANDGATFRPVASLNGGGILGDAYVTCGAAVSPSPTISLSNCNLFDNRGLNGGGIFTNGPLSLTGVNVGANTLGNTADLNCAGVAVFASSSGNCGAFTSFSQPSSTFKNSSISFNKAGVHTPAVGVAGAQGVFGGGYCSYGLDVSSPVPVSLDTVIINANSVINNSTANTTVGAGALLAISGPTTNFAKFKNCTISNNTLNNSNGGGGLYALLSSVTMTGSSIVANAVTGANSLATEGGAGALFVASNAVISTTTVSNNSDTSSYSGSGAIYPGGGIVFNAGTSLGGLVMDQCVVDGNSSGEGGGITIAGGNAATLQNYPTANIVHSTISNNTAAEGAGIAVIDPASAVYLSFSTVSGNGNGQTVTGGGLYDNNGTVVSINNTYTANHGTYGGAVVCGGTGQIDMYNDTVDANTATAFGGLYNQCQSAAGVPHPVLLNNTILADNSGDGTGNDCVGGVTSNGYNLVQSADTASCILATHDIKGQSAHLNAPALNTYGSASIWDRKTMLPQTTSAAIDYVDPAACTYTLLVGPATQNVSDERLAPRPTAAPFLCDIGAVEVPTSTLTVTKTSSGGCTSSATGSVIAGQAVSYVITVSNAGPSDEATVTVTDNFPGVTGVTWACAASGGAACTTASGSGAINNTIAPMPAGSSAVFTANGTVSPSASGTIVNVVDAQFTAAVPATSATCTDTVIPSVDLAIVKTVSQPTVLVGGAVTYTLTASNNGPAALLGGATVTDTVPASLTLGALPSGCTAVGQAVTCAITTSPFASGATQAFAIPVTTTAVGHFDNTAVIATTTIISDPPANNTSTVSLQVKSADQADLSVTKSASPAQLDVGQDVTFTLTATDNGPADATGVILTDTLPPGLTYKSSSAAGAPCAFNSATQVVTCLVGDIANGASASATVVATAAAAGTLTNTVVVVGDQTDGNGSNDTATATVSVTGVADLSIVKVGLAHGTVGDNLTYTLTVTNAGPDDAAQVTVSDTLPAGVRFVSADGPQGTCTEAGGLVTCTLSDLPAATGLNTTDFTVVVVPTNVGTISNIATVTGSGTDDPNPADNTSQTVTTDVKLSGVAPIQAGLFSGGGFVRPGCSASGRGSPWALALVALWLLVRRKR